MMLDRRRSRRAGRASSMGEERRRIGERKNFEHDERDDVEEGIPTAQAASEQTIIFATHDPTYLHTTGFIPHLG